MRHRENQLTGRQVEISEVKRNGDKMRRPNIAPGRTAYLKRERMGKGITQGDHGLKSSRTDKTH